MELRWIFGLFLSMTVPAMGWARSVPSCNQVFQNEIVAPNRNSAIDAKDYPFEHTRGLGDYFFFLGSSFGQKTNSLNQRHTTLDLGGGLGLAHLQLAKNRGVHATVINLQNFPQLWANALVRAKKDPSSVKTGHAHTGEAPFPDTYWVDSVGGISRGDIANTAAVLNIELPRALHKPRTVKDFDKEDVRQSAIEVFQEFKNSFSTQKLNYVTEAVEKVLPRMNAKVDVVTDVFGAFYYSPGRVQLLKSIEQSLKPGGSAYISIVGFYQRGVFDRVQTKDGRDITLFDYLLEKHSQHFRLEGDTNEQSLRNQPPVLILEKSDQPLDLRLQEVKDLPAFDQGGMHVPRRLYQEI